MTTPKRMGDREDTEFKAVVLLRLLMQGQVLHYKDRYWAMADDYRLGCLAIDMDTGKPLVDENGNRHVVCLLDNQLEDFIKWAEELPDEEIIHMGMNAVLQEISAAGGLTIWSYKQSQKEKKDARGF